MIAITILTVAILYVWFRKYNITNTKRRWKQKGKYWKPTLRPYRHKEHILCCGAPPDHKGKCINQPRLML